jgi:hypothetical protein
MTGRRLARARASDGLAFDQGKGSSGFRPEAVVRLGSRAVGRQEKTTGASVASRAVAVLFAASPSLLIGAAGRFSLDRALAAER